MIRYRTRDLTRLLPGTARSMRRIEKITRTSGRYDHPARGQCAPHTDRGTGHGHHWFGLHYQIELVKEGRMDAMHVHVEACPMPQEAERTEAASTLNKRSILWAYQPRSPWADPGTVERRKARPAVVDNR